MYVKRFCKLKRTGKMFIVLMESQLEPNLGFSPARECSMNWYVEHLGVTPSEDEEVVLLTCQEKRQRWVGSTWVASDIYALPGPTARSQNSAERAAPCKAEEAVSRRGHYCCHFRSG